ncbi:MAG: FAD-dependent oxidoreductase [Nitriliruptorales bacterium]|nr:FAD-dependent oxidoreductase [Nitriliruptorales bacterium]
MGSAVAWHLARRGRRVVGLEQFEPGHDLGGSHGRSRIFRLAYGQDDYVRLAVEALPLWRALEDEAGVEILVQGGAIDHGSSVVLDRIGAAFARHGLEAALLGQAEAERRWAGFRFDGPVLYSPDGGRTDADAALFALQQRAAALGAEMRFSSPVRSVHVRGEGVVVETGGDTVEADVVVVTANAWLPKLLSGIVEVPPMRITQEQPAFFAPLDGAATWPSFIHYVGEGQLASDFAAYGVPSPAEGGVKVGEHGTGIEIDPDGERPPPDPVRIERLSDYVRLHLPGLNPDPSGISRCLYDMTADEDFVVDRVGRVVIGGGFSGHGFKFVPSVGRLLADLADGIPHQIGRFSARR